MPLAVCALCSLCHCSGEAAQTPAADAKQGLALALTSVQISAHCSGWAQLRGRPCVSAAFSCSAAPCGQTPIYFSLDPSQLLQQTFFSPREASLPWDLQ